MIRSFPAGFLDLGRAPTIATAQGAGGGISIMEGYRVDRVVLTDPETQASGARTVSEVPGAMRN